MNHQTTRLSASQLMIRPWRSDLAGRVTMKGNLQVVLTTIALFMAGLLVGIWSQHNKPLPPPPFGVMGEFRGFHHHLFGSVPPPPPWVMGGAAMRGGPPNPGEIQSRIQILRSQFEDFQKQLASVEDEFRSSFEAILTPEQKQKLEMVKQRLASLPPPLPGCGPEMGPVFVSTVIYKPLYDHLVEDLTLTSDQQQKLKQLLLERRNKFLTMVDNNPPPSFKLGDMAPPPLPPPPMQ